MSPKGGVGQITLEAVANFERNTWARTLYVVIPIDHVLYVLVYDVEVAPTCGEVILVLFMEQNNKSTFAIVLK